MSDLLDSETSFTDVGSEVSESGASEVKDSSLNGSDVLLDAPQSLFEGSDEIDDDDADDDEDNESTSLQLLLQSRTSVRSVLVSAAINCLLPFLNGMMLGFGEIFAHELGFRWGWSAARVSTIDLWSCQFLTVLGVTRFQKTRCRRAGRA